jgi:hypothetical protein
MADRLVRAIGSETRRLLSEVKSPPRILSPCRVASRRVATRKNATRETPLSLRLEWEGLPAADCSFRSSEKFPSPSCAPLKGERRGNLLKTRQSSRSAVKLHRDSAMNISPCTQTRDHPPPVVYSHCIKLIAPLPTPRAYLPGVKCRRAIATRICVRM